MRWEVGRRIWRRVSRKSPKPCMDMYGRAPVFRGKVGSRSVVVPISVLALAIKLVRITSSKRSGAGDIIAQSTSPTTRCIILLESGFGVHRGSLMWEPDLPCHGQPAASQPLPCPECHFMCRRQEPSCREVSEIPQGKHFGLDFVISQKLVQKRAASACLQWSQGGLVGTVWAGDVASLKTSKS